MLDTSLYLGAFRSKEGAAELERYYGRFTPNIDLSSIVLHELLVGASTAERTRQIRENLVGPLVRAGRVITPSHSAWEQAGVAIAAMARQEARDLPSIAKSLVNDFLLAASCRESETILVTDNTADSALIRKYLKHDFVPTWPSPWSSITLLTQMALGCFEGDATPDRLQRGHLRPSPLESPGCSAGGSTGPFRGRSCMGTKPSGFRRPLVAFTCALNCLAASCAGPSVATAPLHRAPALSHEVDGLIWEAGDWEPHLPSGPAGVSWGNHRAVVEVEGAEGVDAVVVTIPWRRPDPDPASKGIIVVDAATGEAVPNAVAMRVESASGDVAFQPNPGSAIYHVYYLPWQSTGGYYPTITYPTQAQLRDPTPVVRSGGSSVSRAQADGAPPVSWAGLAPNPEASWERRVREAGAMGLPKARATRIQSVNAFHSFFPMEVIATAEERAAFMEGAPQGWRIVGEHRDRPVRMREHIPRHWGELRAQSVSGETPLPAPSAARPRDDIQEPADPRVSGETPLPFTSTVLRDEASTWQVAVVAGDDPLEDVRVDFDGFPDSWMSSFTCFNCGGIDEKGLAFTKRVDVSAGTVQPLWLGVRVPPEQRPGPIEGAVTVSTANRGSQTLPVVLEVQSARAVNHGFDEPELQSRLFWLNSTVGTDPDFIIAPFEPVEVAAGSGGAGASLSVLGRRIELGSNGLPTRILSYFTPELTHFADEPEPILARPLALEVRVDGGGGSASPDSRAGAAMEVFDAQPFHVAQDSPGRARWTAESTSPHFTMKVEGTLEYDGMLDYRMTLVATEDVAVEDIALPISLVPDAAEYMLGLGRKGGRRPTEVDWRWAVENHQEGVWLGGIHKGLQWVLRDENYVRPLNTNFYRNQPLNLPPSWYNEGKGGIRIFEEGAGAGGQGAAADPALAPSGATRQDGIGGPAAAPAAITALNYSGPRTLRAGDTLHFNVRFLVTPFKPIDTRAHFNTRFVHMYVPVDSVAAWGGTVVNIHHANEINPYINYPFFALDQQKAYIDEAHAKGIKVKLYDTIRELTYKAWELFALRSLGDEILNDGEGGGHSWMQEHLRDRYHSAWHAWRVDDAAMLNKGTSRWTNYYVEGLSWLAEHQGIDGLYLDDIAFSRETVKRIVTVLHQERPEVVIDLHSANQFNVRDGFINSAFLYMEHFPFISRLWFGEYFEYGLDEDYWLTEVSGLPFGLMGEMLQDGGHPYRGMLYGMTGRRYGDTDPRPVWAMMNDFGLADSRMKGYWLQDTPVTTSHPRVLATSYLREDGRALVALASWSERDEVVRLDVDWSALGVEGSGAARAYAPAVAGLQDAAEVDLAAVRVPAGMGLFVVITPGDGG